MREVRRRNLPMVVDADGLWLVNQDPSLVAGKCWLLVVVVSSCNGGSCMLRPTMPGC